MSDFDRKLEELRRGTEGLKAPEGFDAALNAKLVAAAALPPAVAGAGLAWGLRLLIGVAAFAGAGGGVWWATGAMRDGRPAASSASSSVAPAPSPPPKGLLLPQVGPGTAPSSAPPPEVANLGQPGTPAGLLKPEGTVSATPPGSDAGSGGDSLSVSSDVLAVFARGTLTMCGRQVDQVALVSHGPALAGIHKWAGKSDHRLSGWVEAKSLTLGRKDPSEMLVTGRLVVDGGPGLRGVNGDVQMVDEWFIATATRNDRLEIVVNEYRPIVLTFAQLQPGAHFVGDIHLQWVGHRPADDRKLKVTVEGDKVDMARVRLFPMWCDRKGKWTPGHLPIEDIPSSGNIYTHMSATRYRVAAYAPGSAPAWADVMLDAAADVSQTLRIERERPVRAELATREVEVDLTMPWRPEEGIDFWFKPGREIGSRCLDFGDEWTGVVVHEPVGHAQPLKPDELARRGERCITFGETMVFQSQYRNKWIAVKFHR